MPTARNDERKQFLTDVLTTAVEGGINYWASVDEYEWDVPLGEAYVVVRDMEDDTTHRVDLDVIAKGIGIEVAGKWDPGSYFAQFVIANRTNGKDGDFDASVADVILQAGIFGKVVYG